MSILDRFRAKPTVLCTECGRPFKLHTDGGNDKDRMIK